MRTAMGAAAIAVGLAGCAMDLGYSVLFTTHNRYEIKTCPELAPIVTGLLAREKQIAALSDKAAQEASGLVVNAVGYGPELVNVRADLRVALAAARAKNCTEPVFQTSAPG